jgi:hypothetical protein
MVVLADGRGGGLFFSFVTRVANLVDFFLRLLHEYSIAVFLMVSNTVERSSQNPSYRTDDLVQAGSQVFYIIICTKKY